MLNNNNMKPKLKVLDDRVRELETELRETQEKLAELKKVPARKERKSKNQAPKDKQDG
jgi:prefoldin subunit 5